MEVPTIYKAYFQAYARGYTPKIWPYMVQYLHFGILKFPLKWGVPKINWCLARNGWEWGNGMIIDSYCGSFPHSLLSTRNWLVLWNIWIIYPCIVILPNWRTPSFFRRGRYTTNQLKWRYLPYIRPVFQAYVRGYTPKIWPYMVQYLHFGILKFPLKWGVPKIYWCLARNGWEWGNGMIIDSYCGSFPHSLLSTRNWLVLWNIWIIYPYIGKNDPNWRTHIFQKGLKPPTS